MDVIKRDGSKEKFNSEKINSAILKAFKACNYTLNELEKNAITDFCYTLEAASSDGVDVESIQDKVEHFLASRKEWFDVTKAFILYREKHKEARIISEKLGYIHKYVNSSKAGADLSNTDDNANSSQKNAANLDGELHKDTNRIIQRKLIKELLEEIGSPFKDDYIKDLVHHILYQHDETGLMKPYCSAYTMYPLLIDGTSNIDGTKNHAPKHLSSFVGQFQNLVFLLSSQKKGAGAYGEFFNFFSYFCEKEWGENYWQKEDIVITNEHCKEKRTIGSTIDQYFQSITHYINQPSGNRGSQSPLN